VYKENRGRSREEKVHWTNVHRVHGGEFFTGGPNLGGGGPKSREWVRHTEEGSVSLPPVEHRLVMGSGGMGGYKSTGGSKHAGGTI